MGLSEIVPAKAIELTFEPNLTKRGGPRKRGPRQLPKVNVLWPDGQKVTYRTPPLVMPTGPVEAIGLMVVDPRTLQPYLGRDGKPYILPVRPMIVVATEADDTLLTFDEVANRAGVSRSSVKRAVERGELPKPKPVGGRAVRFTLGQVRNWLGIRLLLSSG